MAKVLRKVLLSELKKVQPTLGKGSSLEVLRGMLVEVKDNNFKISGTNLETSVITSFEYDGGMLPEEFSFIIDGRMFVDIISKISSEEVNISFKDGIVSINGEGSSFNISEMGTVSTFPTITEGDSDNTITISSNAFRDVISKTVGFITEDDSRPVLSGVKLEFSHNKLKGVSLDGYRLGYVEKEIENDVDVNFLVPGQSLLNVNKALDKDTVSIRYSDNSDLVGFIIGNTTVYAKQLAGQFFDYKSILKHNDCPITIKVNLQDLTDAIDRATIMARNNNKFNPITINLSDKELIISTKSEIGDIKENVSVKEFEGKGLDAISFNPQYLLEGLKTCKSEIIELRFSTSLNPGFILEQESNFIYLALPIRLVSSEAAA